MRRYGTPYKERPGQRKRTQRVRVRALKTPIGPRKQPGIEVVGEAELDLLDFEGSDLAAEEIQDDESEFDIE